MAKGKTREIFIKESKGKFSLSKDNKIAKKDYNFTGLLALRQILNNEKARLIHIIKTQKPQSIYELSKKAGRTFKAVSDDIKLLERFGFVQLVEEKTKNRIRHKPEVIVDSVTVHFKI